MSKELAVAIEAAHLAAKHLRAAFHSPAPPHDTEDHAIVDKTAEESIRAHLLKAFPTYGYLGEETGHRNPTGDSMRMWVVDPNDGTRAFQRGFRGAATSIALLEDGVPVVGVVHAYNYPDDKGEIVTWCKGGELCRNAKLVPTNRTSATNLPLVVLVSQSADRNPEANISLISPMRYRAMPSIAWRMALVATGEGDATLCLYGPKTWDLAGGHALLLGAGLNLYSSCGEPVTYSCDGELHLPGDGHVFGGDKDVIDILRKKDWSRVFHRPKRTYPYTLSWPVRAKSEPDPGVLSRAQGCLLGQLAGDALGSQAEWKTPEQIRDELPDAVTNMEGSSIFNTIAGQPTDDSEMALLLARSLVKGTRPANAYQFWLTTHPFDCGITIGDALRSGKAGISSESNGALMRISPLGIAGATILPDTRKLDQMVIDDTTITHKNPICIQINILYVRAISDAIRNGTGPEAIHEKISTWASELDMDHAIGAVIETSCDRPPDDYHTHRGWVLIAFWNALYQLLHAKSLEDALIATVSAGGDTDTNAAICGALLGAIYGRDALPFNWRQSILTCRPSKHDPTVRQPRPECLWPVDALILAEKLLCNSRSNRLHLL